jgi:hypothetical protein
MPSEEAQIEVELEPFPSSERRIRAFTTLEVKNHILDLRKSLHLTMNGQMHKCLPKGFVTHEGLLCPMMNDPRKDNCGP